MLLNISIINSFFQANKLYLEQKYKILIFIGDHNNALDCIKTLHKKHPSIDYVREISNIYAEQSNYEESEKVIQEFLNLIKLILNYIKV